MSLVNMKELLSDVNGYGVAAFNLVDFSSTKACVEQAEEMRSPLILQVSPKTVRFWGASAIVSWVKECASKSKTPVTLHLDHCADFDFIQMCIDAGWTSIMYDGSSLPFDENLANTIKMANLAHSRGVSIEGEVGAIGGVEDDLVVDDEAACLADPQQAIQLAREAELDVVAAACGTAHGMYKREPRVHIDLLKTIYDGCGVPLALHGGTGLSDEVFHNAIAVGCKKINVSTQLKITGIDADFDYITNHRTEYNPLKVYENRLKEYKKMVAGFLTIFGSVGKVAASPATAANPSLSPAG